MTAAVIPGRSPAQPDRHISAAAPGCQEQPVRAEHSCVPDMTYEIGGESPDLGP